MVWASPALAYFILGLMIVQRLAEVVFAGRNTRALLARGAVESGRGHYPVMVAMHTVWLVAIVLLLPHPPFVRVMPLAAFVVLQALRIWVLLILGPYFTTRIISLPGAPLIRRGPYKYLRHPNYLVVVGEIAAFPLIYGEFAVAIVFSVLNAAMLYWRIREEELALAPRRASGTSS